MGLDLRKAAIVAMMSASIAGGAQAQPITALAASYRLDVGPITPITIDFAAAFSPSDVRASAEVRTRGISAIFSEYNAKAQSDGVIENDLIRPSRFSLTQYRRDPAALQWSAVGKLTMSHPAHRSPVVQAKIEQAMTAETADPVTAILRVATTLGKSPCASTQRIFDGLDVVDLTFSDRDAAQLAGKSAYRGPVRRCEVRWHAVAGRAAERGDPDDVYGLSFALLGPLASGQPFWLPVAMTGSIKGLGFSAYATRINLNGADLATAGTN
jgi:hypothetical protein